MFERFTDRSRKVMSLANQEAQRFNHEYVGTEHILLGLIKEGGGVGCNVLKNLDVDLRKARLEVEKLVKSGPDMVTMGKLPQTPRARKVIELAMAEARSLNHTYVGTEHILLGLLAEHDGVAAQVLMNLGLKLETVREETLNLLGAAVDSPKITVTAPVSSAKANELRRKIAALEAQKDEAIKSADYEPAAKYRDEAEALKKELDTLRTKCDKCKNDATIHLSELKGGEKTIKHLCEVCSALQPNIDGKVYQMISQMTASQVKQLIEPPESEPQALLEALLKVETGLFEVLNALTDPKLMIQCDAAEMTESVIETARFVQEFTKFRDKLLS